MHPTILQITERIVLRSQSTRAAYLRRLEAARRAGVHRGALSCTNLAHGFASFPINDKLLLKQDRAPSVAIVSSYNDMLSAHQPFERFPKIIKDAVRAVGGVAQFAGGTPAMCDGVTQGQPGMELSLFSRDTIAMATAIALSHNMFDAGLFLGICDKIVPGLLIGALHFGHLPAVFVPGGPMTSGLSNKDKTLIRQQYAEGKINRAALLDAESKSYHGPGTCTFYGTANSNQMLMEAFGLHLPGAAFIPPNTPLRDALTAEAARQVLKITDHGPHYTPVGHVISEKSIVNALVALLTTGGSTNHTIHLVAIAKAAGIHIDWDDVAQLSSVVPLLARIYPNGDADVNHFHAAGGTGFVIRECLDAGFMHEDVKTILSDQGGGSGLRAHCAEPFLTEKGVIFKASPAQSGDESVLRQVAAPFSPEGGLRVLTGNLGRAIIKMSAVNEAHWVVDAPAIVFDSQEAFMQAFKAGELNQDFIAVLVYQGPRANGMPELHALTPALGSLQDKGFHVALVTDGRMSGASGRVPAAIHVTPEAFLGGPLAWVRTGDRIRVDAVHSTLSVLLAEDVWQQRQHTEPLPHDLSAHETGMGRELFALFRRHVSSAEEGGVIF